MSDSSDSEFLTNNVYRNESTVISARGPNMNANNIPGISLSDNVSSTIYKPRIGESQIYAISNYNQHSMGYRRETSPMSIMSACDMRQRNLNNSYYPRGPRSQRSGFNVRGQSPMSIRSIDSSASVSAAEIVMALKSMNYNKHDLRMIKDAYNKLMKHRVRKKIEKRRKLRLILKGSRRRSGYDSGEQASDSSLSSDDRSTKISNNKETMSSCRSTKTDFSNFKRTIKESEMYKDCTDNFRQSSLRKLVGPSNLNTTSTSSRGVNAGPSICSFNYMSVPANFNNMQSKPNVSIVPLKERFKNGFLLPPQRFNRSVVPSTISENLEMNNMSNGNNIERNVETDSDLDDMFSVGPSKQKTITNNIQRKRSIDSNDNNLPSQKRTKLASPCKNSIEIRKAIPKETTVNTTSNNHKTNDFVFAKPTFPLRKCVNLKTNEKLLAKSAAPLSDTIVQVSANPSVNIKTSEPKESTLDENEHNEDHSNTAYCMTDLSMRPSFRKRKLFTQNLDVTEKKNSSIDNFEPNSPQNSIYSVIQKEKHKVRKLQQVTTQSCLSRDVEQDESNLLDLIHKLIPQEKMNVTNQTKKTDLQNSKNKTQEDDDKWDVTSIISTKNNDEDCSDTYTDEEILNASLKAVPKENVLNKPSPNKKKKICKEAEELPANTYKQYLPSNSNIEKHDVVNKSAKICVQKGIKTFWDTDFESDAECIPPPINGELKENIRTGNSHEKEVSKFQSLSSIFNTKKTELRVNVSNFLNNTGDSLHNKIRIKSHRTPKKKKLDQTRDEDAKSFYVEPQSKRQTSQANSCVTLSKSKPVAQSESRTIKPIKDTTDHSNQDNKNTLKHNKRTSKINKHNDTVDSITEQQTKKQGKNNKNQDKRNQDVQKMCKTQKQECVLNEEITKKQTSNKMQKNATKAVRKATNKEQDLIKNNEQSKNPGKNNKNKTPDKSREESISKKRNNNKKVEKVAENKAKNKKQSPKNKILSKTTTEQSNTLNEDTIPEENNNRTYRALRSCRSSKQNSSLDLLKSNETLNESVTRTLRSRQIVHSILNGNVTKAEENVNNNAKHSKSALSDVSFSLGVSKRTNSRLIKTKYAETSDTSISFSLTNNSHSKENQVTSAKSRVNSRAGKKQNNVTNKKSTPNKENKLPNKEIFVPKHDIRPCRIRILNKRYLI